MLRFKEYIQEETQLITEEITHEQIADIGDKFDSIKNALLGKKSSVKLTREYPGGIPLTFGVDPKTKKTFVGHDGVKHFNHGEIESMHGDTSMAEALKNVLTHAHKVIPRSGGTYEAKYHKFSKRDGRYSSNKLSTHADSKEGRRIKNALFSLHIKGKHDVAGNLKPVDLSKMESHPDVHLMDHHLDKVAPAEFSPEEQSAYTNHMLRAKNSYAKLDPEFFDSIGNHSKEMMNFLASYQGDKPPKKTDYIDYLKNKHENDMNNQLGPKQKDRVSRRLNDLLANTSDKGFEHFISMMYHIDGSNKILKGVGNKQHNDYEGNIPIMVHHKGTVNPL